MIRLVALACGILCGIGMGLSGLIDPSRVQGFLIPKGPWDPTLGLGLLGVVAVAWVVLLITRRALPPLLGGEAEAGAVAQGSRLLAGSALFGLGWGLAGYFPLAALVQLGAFAPGAFIFLASVLAGMILHDLATNKHRWPGAGGRRSGG